MQPTTVKRKREDEKLISDGKASFTATNLGKEYFPGEKITKGMILEYYQKVSGFILPHLKNRPQSMYRNPSGIASKGFFQKDVAGLAPDWAETYIDYSDSSKRRIEYLLCNNKITLAYMNNLGCIELNPWHSTIKNPDKPDYLIIDLDPSEGNTFRQVIDTARVVKTVLDKAGIQGYAKTSGATGIHIYIPAGTRYTYDQVRDFACIVCMLTHDVIPEFTTMERKVAVRGNKIYLDCHQNGQGQTIASVYSVRPRAGATVSTPLEWGEITDHLDPHDFTIFNVPKRLEKKGDLFSGILGKGADLMKGLKALER